MMAALVLAARAQDTATVHISSPYTDYEEATGWGFRAGYFAANTGAANVGPQGSAIIGATYSMHLSGPVRGVARFQYAPSQRTQLDPYLAADSGRNQGLVKSPLYMLDIGIALDLTGEKSWHHVIPTVGFALGLAYDPQAPDVGNYKFGTKFYIGLGGGVEYALKGPWVLRADVWDYLWQLSYPQPYFTGNINPVLALNAPDKEWTNNAVLTVGLTYKIAH